MTTTDPPAILWVPHEPSAEEPTSDDAAIAKAVLGDTERTIQQTRESLHDIATAIESSCRAMEATKQLLARKRRDASALFVEPPVVEPMIRWFEV